MASPFIILGSGFLRAVFAVLETRGAPWIMRGSVIRLVSRCAGATVKLSVSGLDWVLEFSSIPLVGSLP
jgi:hypothetical protein